MTVHRIILWKILREYEKKDSRIKIIDQKNQGAGAARNHGMSVARGEYLSFLDSDDFFDKDMLKDAYEAAHACEADVCVFDADLFNHTTKTFRKCTWAFRRQFFPDRNPFSPLDEDVRENIFRMFNGWPWDKTFSQRICSEDWSAISESQNDKRYVFCFYRPCKSKKNRNG